MSFDIAQFLERPIPPVTPETAGWWEETRKRVLTVQVCQDCSTSQFYPRILCTSCGSTRIELVPASGSGSIYSYTVIDKSPDPERFAAPYVVALIELAEGPVLLSNIVSASDGQLCIGAAVTVTWDPLPDGRHLPVFELVTS